MNGIVLYRQVREKWNSIKLDIWSAVSWFEESQSKFTYIDQHLKQENWQRPPKHSKIYKHISLTCVPSLLPPLPELSSNKTDGSCVSIYGSHDVTSLKLDFWKVSLPTYWFPLSLVPVLWQVSHDMGNSLFSGVKG